MECPYCHVDMDREPHRQGCFGLVSARLLKKAGATFVPLEKGEPAPSAEPRDHGLTAEERATVLQHAARHLGPCRNCTLLHASSLPNWDIQGGGGGEHFGLYSRYEPVVTVACSNCGELHFFLLNACLEKK